ncbi:MAG: RHS repeat-associated core domain-containing protein [Thermoguttaceae bacterium]|nr:RHS repeat-associated core domain-containing protein [Thermoguttaceae bacterium]
MSCSYDGLNRRVRKTTASETREYYYNKNWQCLEEYLYGTLQNSYLWGLRYLDDLICFTPDYTIALTDANFNVVAVANQSGLTERYTYTAFGQRTILTPSYAPRSESMYPALTRTFTSQVLDLETGLMLYRNRYYALTLGRFITRDPIGYEGRDENLYRYVENSPIDLIDIWGFENSLCSYLKRTYYNASVGLANSFLGTYYYFQDITCVTAETVFLLAGYQDYRYVECSEIGKTNQANNPNFWKNAFYNSVRTGMAAGTCGSSEIIAALFDYWETGDIDLAQQRCFGIVGMYFLSAGVTRACTPTYRSGTMAVSRWGKPGLQSGNWVMGGKTSFLNYILSGKWQPGFTNEFASYSTGENYLVPANTLRWPTGWETLKGFWGQYQYFPEAPLPPSIWEIGYPIPSYYASPSDFKYYIDNCCSCEKESE